MSVQAMEKKLKGMHMPRDLAVKGGKYLKQEEKHIQDHGIGDNAAQRLELLLSGIKFGNLLDDQAQQHQQGRPRAEGGRKESCRHDGGQPEMPTGNACIQKCRHRMNGERPGNGNISQNLYPLLVLHPFSFRRQHVPPHNNVQQQVNVEYNHIPEED